MKEQFYTFFFKYFWSKFKKKKSTFNTYFLERNSNLQSEFNNFALKLWPSHRGTSPKIGQNIPPALRVRTISKIPNWEFSVRDFAAEGIFWANAKRIITNTGWSARTAHLFGKYNQMPCGLGLSNSSYHRTLPDVYFKPKLVAVALIVRKLWP